MGKVISANGVGGGGDDEETREGGHWQTRQETLLQELNIRGMGQWLTGPRTKTYQTMVTPQSPKHRPPGVKWETGGEVPLRQTQKARRGSRQVDWRQDPYCARNPLIDPSHIFLANTRMHLPIAETAQGVKETGMGNYWSTVVPGRM